VGVRHSLCMIASRYWVCLTCPYVIRLRSRLMLTGGLVQSRWNILLGVMITMNSAMATRKEAGPHAGIAKHASAAACR
jgi:hypothetical protein